MDFIKEIEKLKKEKNAVILVHNYQPASVKDIADITGDSLELSRKAAETEADIIVFCGVHFMAETAAVLSPEKKVILPEPDAGCPMADMVDAAALREFKKKHPGIPVVTYVNSTAAVKAESDYCCTSANAARVIESIPSDKIIFVPDRNLGAYSAKISGKEALLWEGYCPVHEIISKRHISEARRLYPGAAVMAHPECRPEVLLSADHVLSTSGMIKTALESECGEFIVATETDMISTLKKAAPGKKFHAAFEGARCRNMKKITVEKVYDALKNESPIIKPSEEVAAGAKKAVMRMMEAGK